MLRIPDLGEKKEEEDWEEGWVVPDRKEAGKEGQASSEKAKMKGEELI